MIGTTSEHNTSNCLSEWFPLLVKLDVPVPLTTIVRADVGAIRSVLDGERPEEFDSLVKTIRTTIESEILFGYPCFLRTGEFSGKHRWSKTCLIDRGDTIAQHVYSLIEESELVDIMGLPWGRWVVRRLLRTEPAFIAWDGLPICREARVFFDNEGIVCYHPYWPHDAFDKYSRPSVADWSERLDKLNTFSFADILPLAERVRKAFRGYWSVDFLWAEKQWWVIDMAHGEQSWHWPHCEKSRAGGPF